MAKNTYQQLNLQNKLSKQEEQRQNHAYREHEHFDGCQMGAVFGRLGKEVKGLTKYGDYLESYQLEGGRGRIGEKVQGRSSMVSRHKVDGER